MRMAIAGFIAATSVLAGAPMAVGTAAGPAAGSRQEPVTPVPPRSPGNEAKAALGKVLFGDTRLSRDGAFSCRSCHDLASNGAMGGRAEFTSRTGATAFNTQTVFNAALSFRLNWAGNARTLQDQAAMALESPDSMDSGAGAAAQRLAADPAMRQAFARAYGRGPDATTLLDALTAFERTLVTPGSRFDLWLGGQNDALTPLELGGYKTFKAVGCISCHQGVNLGGNLFQYHGIFRSFGGPAPTMLRVPSLRNVATTAPYFHDGSAPNLTDAVRIMSVAQLGRELSEVQIEGIVAFLGTLTGRYEGAWVAQSR